MLLDSDDSLIENESDGDNDLLLSDNDVGNKSNDASHGIDISDEESSDRDVPSTSLAAQLPPTTQARTRNNHIWGPGTRQPQLDNFSGNPGSTTLASVVDVENCLEYFHLIITDNILDIVVEKTNHLCKPILYIKYWNLANTFQSQ